MTLHLAPRRSPRSGDVNRGDAGVEEGGHQVGGYPPSDLLDDDRDLEGGTERFDPAEEPGEAGVALGL